MSPNIIWLASYPKSGNTWFRCFISALTNPTFSLNNLETHGIFSSKGTFESILDLDIDSIPLNRTDEMRREAYRHRNAQAKSQLFVKVHDACIVSPYDGLRQIPEGITRATVYLVRDPRDVAVSLTNHNGKDHEHSVYKNICNVEAALVKQDKGNNQLYQPLSTWQNHYYSWVEQDDLNVEVIRYEDMLDDPMETFSRAIRHMELDYTPEEISQAINATTFDKLKAKEEEEGFVEKPSHTRSFFNKGKKGRWEEILTPAQVAEIERVNEKAMRELGYL